MLKTVVFALAGSAIVASTSALDNRHRAGNVSRLTTGCQVLLPDDSVMVRIAIRRIVSDTETASVELREYLHAPFVSADSVVEYRVDTACDSAATSYQAKRASKGEPNVFIPVVLFKIHGSSKYVGTGLIYYGENKQFVVFDSVFTVLGTLNTN